jgi:hypothetical protein
MKIKEITTKPKMKKLKLKTFSSFPIPPVSVLPLACDPCPIILLNLF